MTMNEDDRKFIAEGREILAMEWLGSYEEEQTKMYLGLILTKYEELVSADASPEVIDVLKHETSVIVGLIRDPEIGERAREIMRATVVGMPDPTPEDLAAKPAAPGLYLDRWGNVWRLHQDGVFAMSSRIRASAAFYAPFKRLEVVEDRPDAAVAPQEPKKCTSAYCSQRDDQHVSTCPNWATPQEQRSKVPPIIEHAEAFTKPDDVTQMTVLLMRAWGENDTNSDVSQYPTSYVATFVDMARAVLAAPVAVDEAKLAEVINFALDESQGEEPSEVFVARAIAESRAEWLGGGER